MSDAKDLEHCSGRNTCLGHADQRTAGVTCSRCHGTRWMLVRPASAPDPSYTCQRCTHVLAGYQAVADPLGVRVSPEARAARVEGLRRAREIQAQHRVEQAPTVPDAEVEGMGGGAAPPAAEKGDRRPGRPLRPARALQREAAKRWARVRQRLVAGPACRAWAEPEDVEQTESAR